jgi:hypothetical protein
MEAAAPTVDLHKTERYALHKPGFRWKKRQSGIMDIIVEGSISDPLYEALKACIDRSGKTAVADVLSLLTDCWLAANPAQPEHSSPSPSTSPLSPQPAGEGTSRRCRHNRNVRKRTASEAWEDKAAKEAANKMAARCKRAAQQKGSPPPTTPKPINPLAPTTAQSTPTMTTSCGKCTPQLVTIGHHSCNCNHSTQPQTVTDQPEIIDLTQPANRPTQAPHRPTDSPKPNRRFRRVADIAKVARAIRTNRTKHTDAAVANLVNCLSRDQSKKGKTISAAVRKATAARVRKHRKSTAIIQHFEEAVLTFNSAHPEDPISMGEVCSIWTLRHDAKLESLIHSSPEFEKLKTAWTDEGIETLLDAMHMSPDECLLLKEKMMVSYAGWDEMRKTAGMQYAEGAYNLKQLAKDYNSVLNDKLGFEAVADGKGYRVSLKSLHFWVVEQAIAGGFVDPAKVPRTTQCKESMDGGNLGSRNAELVAICPMNLGK